MWVLTIGNFSKESEEEITEFKDNREFLIYSNLRRLDSVSIPIRSVTIQGHIINIEESSINRIDFVDKEIIRHFLKIGLLDHIPNDMELRNIILAEYCGSYGKTFPNIDIKNPLDINIDVHENNIEELIMHKLNVKVGEYEKGNKYKYLNKNSEEEYFYLNAVTKEDIWKDEIDIFERIENNKHLSEEDKIQLIKDYKRSLEDTCPKGKLMLTLQYETLDNVQLRFLTKEYLEESLEFNESCSCFMIGSSSEKGKNGNIARYEYLMPVDEKFNEEIEIELFSKYIHRE